MNKKLLLSLSLLFMAPSTFANELFHETTPKFATTSVGKLLVGRYNLALYTFKSDLGSPIPPKCTSKQDNGPLGSCLARWPAAAVELSQLADLVKDDNKFGAVYNNDINKLQLSYAGLPLYYWYKDTPQHNFTGDGINDAWSLILLGQPPTMFAGFEHF